MFGDRFSSSTSCSTWLHETSIPKRSPSPFLKLQHFLMIPSCFTESDVEDAACDWLESLDWSIAHGPDIAPDVPDAERANE